MSKNKLGLVFGVSAYGLWGLFPLYWPLLKPADALEIVSHRAVWTLVFCIIILGITKALKSTLITLKRPQVALKLFAASFLISVNWLVYIWATNNGHVVEASLGYYINPLIGRLFFQLGGRRLKLRSPFCILLVQVMTEPVADLDVFMGNRWANMGSLLGSF